MFDKALVLIILQQIEEALRKIAARAVRFQCPEAFSASPSGMETLDSICMLLLATGEALKKIDKITQGELLARYPDIDWKGIIGVRNVIAHQYFDVDTEQVFWICTRELDLLSKTIHQMIQDMQ